MPNWRQAKSNQRIGSKRGSLVTRLVVATLLAAAIILLRAWFQPIFMTLYELLPITILIVIASILWIFGTRIGSLMAKVVGSLLGVTALVVLFIYSPLEGQQIYNEVNAQATAINSLQVTTDIRYIPMEVAQ